MFRAIISTVFHALIVVVAAAVAVWLTITGHTLHVGGLLMAIGAVLGAVMFGFRLADGFGPDHLSIWAGPLSAMRPAAPGVAKNHLTKTRPAASEDAPETEVLRKPTFTENVIMTVKVVTVFGLIGAALWAADLWTAAR